MNDTKKKIRSERIQNPFDDGVGERLCRMGVISADGEVNRIVLEALSNVYAGVLFDDMCDFYQDYNSVETNLRQLFAVTETAEEHQKFLLICLQYDGLRQPLPNPIWWISGNPELATAFADNYILHLKQISNFEEAACS